MSKKRKQSNLLWLIGVISCMKIVEISYMYMVVLFVRFFCNGFVNFVSSTCVINIDETNKSSLTMFVILKVRRTKQGSYRSTIYSLWERYFFNLRIPICEFVR